MPVIRQTAQAEEDLIDIWPYIAPDNPIAADHLLDEIEERFSLLADQPQLGPARPDIAEECRYFPVGNDLILYRIIPVSYYPGRYRGRPGCARFPPSRKPLSLRLSATDDNVPKKRHNLNVIRCPVLCVSTRRSGVF